MVETLCGVNRVRGRVEAGGRERGDRTGTDVDNKSILYRHGDKNMGCCLS